jgi:hypothetical protein
VVSTLSERSSTVSALMKLSDRSQLIFLKEVKPLTDFIFSGFLLMRVRDELKMTIAAYQTLYKSSVTFGMRKQIQAEQGKADLENKIVDLEKQKEILQEKVIRVGTCLIVIAD